MSLDLKLTASDTSFPLSPDLLCSKRTVEMPTVRMPVSLWPIIRILLYDLMTYCWTVFHSFNVLLELFRRSYIPIKPKPALRLDQPPPSSENRQHAPFGLVSAI